jgi:glycosyltransferase involved in cell wall biosynthesis
VINDKRETVRDSAARSGHSPRSRGRLCMVVHGEFPLDPRVAREARAARAAGYEVDVLGLRRAGEPSAEMVDGIRAIRLPFAHKRNASALGLLKEYLGFTALATLRMARLMLRRRYRIVQVHNPPDFLMVAALVPKLLGACVVFDVHDLSPDMFDMRFRGWPGAGGVEFVLRLVERAACGFADAVITVHEPYRRELTSRGVPEAKTTVVMNTVDETLLPTRFADSHRSGFRIVYHGTVTPHYGVDLLVAAFASVRDEIGPATVEIYGEGDHLGAIRAQVEELGLADQVLIRDEMLPQRDVLERVCGASLGVIPNRPTRLNRFALSSKLFEYVALGIPVVSADLPTIHEHFGDNEVLFFRAGDAASLGQALLEAARDPKAAAARAAAARRRYEAYRWPTNAERYVGVLDQLIVRRG